MDWERKNKCEVLLHQYLQWQTQSRVVVQVSTLWKCGKNYKIFFRASPWLGNITQTLYFLSLQILRWWWIKIIILVVNDKEVSFYQKTETLTKSVCGIGVGDRGDASVQSSRAYSKANIQYLPHEQVHHQPFLDGLWYLSVFRSWTRLVSVACSKY